MRTYIAVFLFLCCSLLTQAQVTRANEGEEDSSCYPHDEAYLTGTMNIRESHTTASEILGKTKAGYIFKVLDSLQGPTYCWLDIGDRWIADTALVRGTDTGDGVPAISGEDAALTIRVENTMTWMRRHQQHWFDYVAEVTDKIFSNRRPGSWAMASKRWGAGAWVPYQQTYVWGVRGRHASQVFLFSLLVHEACHHHQAAEGRLALLSDRAKERECWQKQISAIREVSPRSPFIEELRRGLRRL